MRSLRFTRAPLALMVMAFTVASCGLGSSSNGTPTNNKDIIVGISEPLTGDKSDIGTNSDNGYKVWESVVNANGGINGRKVKIIQYDNNSLADTAVSQYQKLVTVDNADVLLGPVSSALVIPTEAVAAQYKKVFVEGTGGSPQVFERNFNNVFFVQPATVEHQADPLVNWVKSLPADQRPTVAGYPTNDDPFAQAVADAVQKSFEAMGIKTGYRQTYPPTQTDFTSIGSQLKAAKVDILVQGSVADQDAAGAVKGYSQVGFQPKVSYFASGPDSASTWLQLLDKKAEGTMTSLDWLQESAVPGNKEFVAAYLKLFPNKDNVVPAEAAEAYAAGEVLAAAIKATGGVDNAKLITWLHANKVQSIEGNFGWDAAGRPQGGTFDMIQWQNGKLVVAYPADVATNGTKPTIPKPTW
jgi:branched-chain amino acid transport system substrate-binding protein